MVDWTGFPRDRFPFDWCESWGEDRCGVWCAFVIDNVRQVLRWCPPGRFLMGSPENEQGRLKYEPQHEVTLTKGFWLADTACTQALWETVMGRNRSRFRMPERPVERVSWSDAQEFLNRLRRKIVEPFFQLPTEAQWEYACRAGTSTPFWFGDLVTTDQANHNGVDPYGQGSYRGETVPVKVLSANGWGLFQMHGNVREWCADAWNWNLGYEPATDPIHGVGAHHVVRGGSWLNTSSDLRSAYRHGDEPNKRVDDLGFRLALGEKQPSHQQQN